MCVGCACARLLCSLCPAAVKATVVCGLVHCACESRGVPTTLRGRPFLVANPFAAAALGHHLGPDRPPRRPVRPRPASPLRPPPPQCPPPPVPLGTSPCPSVPVGASPVHRGCTVQSQACSPPRARAHVPPGGLEVQLKPRPRARDHAPLATRARRAQGMPRAHRAQPAHTQRGPRLCALSARQDASGLPPPSPRQPAQTCAPQAGTPQGVHPAAPPVPLVCTASKPTSPPRGARALATLDGTARLPGPRPAPARVLAVAGTPVLQGPSPPPRSRACQAGTARVAAPLARAVPRARLLAKWHGRRRVLRCARLAPTALQRQRHPCPAPPGASAPGPVSSAATARRRAQQGPTALPALWRPPSVQQVGTGATHAALVHYRECRVWFEKLRGVQAATWPLSCTAGCLCVPREVRRDP